MLCGSRHPFAANGDASQLIPELLLLLALHRLYGRGTSTNEMYTRSMCLCILIEYIIQGERERESGVIQLLANTLLLSQAKKKQQQQVSSSNKNGHNLTSTITNKVLSLSSSSMHMHDAVKDSKW